MESYGYFETSFQVVPASRLDKSHKTSTEMVENICNLFTQSKVELRNKDPSFECAELILLGNIGNIRRIKTLANKNIIAGFCC